MHKRTDCNECLAKLAATVGIALLAGALPAHGASHGGTIWGSKRPAFQAGSAFAKCDSTIAQQLAQPTKTRLNVIVQFQEYPGPGQLHSLSQKGASIYRHLSFIHAVAMNVPTHLLSTLADDPQIAHISSDEGVKKTDAFTVGNSYAYNAWKTYNDYGSGVGVAVLDTGISSVSDFNGVGLLGLGSRLIQSVSFSSETTTKDKCGHGTHVAGIIAGDGSQSSGLTYTQTFAGIAPQCNLISVKVLDQTGSGTVSGVISGVNWCIQNAKQYNIRVINMSLGHPIGQSYTTDPLCQAVEAAWKSGIVVVCAAGNDGRQNVNPTNGAPNGGYGTNYGSIEVPGNDPYVITVGAMKQTDNRRADDTVATYSSRGPSLCDYVLKPDIMAPGNKVISTEDKGSSYLVNTYGSQVQIPNSDYCAVTLGGYSSSYFMLSGTSMATPVVSGAAALMIAQYPKLSPDTIKLRLMASADKWGNPDGTFDACSYGSGYLNIPSAMASTLVATTYAMSPTLYEDSSGDVRISQSFLYGNNALWGSGLPNASAIYGQNALWGANTANSQNALWGNDTLSSSNALWGANFWSTSMSTTITSQSMNLSSSCIIVNGE